MNHIRRHVVDLQFTCVTALSNTGSRSLLESFDKVVLRVEVLSLVFAFRLPPCSAGLLDLCALRLKRMEVRREVYSASLYQ